MAELATDIKDLRAKLDQAFDRLGIVKKEQELAEYEREMSQPEFWADQAIAKDISVKHAKLKDQIEPWLNLARELQELADLADMNDKSMESELAGTLDQLKQKYDELEFQLNFSGEYDVQAAILTIQAGAGGTDAQDWVQMLSRMYVRWAEQQAGMDVKLLEETPGEEAGLKNTTLLIDGAYAYGKLKGEHGVHRLVRLSPFNTAHTRETSFAMVEVAPQIEQPEQVVIDETELKIDVYRAGGHGGQSVNTTDSAVRITHVPTGISVAIQNERSQLQNKETALTILRSKLARLQQEQHTKTLADLKGPNIEAAWGNQIRNYVLHPYQLVKDNRSGHQSSEVQAVLDGDLNQFIDAYLSSQPPL